MPERPGLLRRALAEGIAAFALVFAGCGAGVTNATHQGALGAVGISLVFGLVIMVMIYATGHLSGAHINPAVTIAFTLTRHFPRRDALAHVVAPLPGARPAGVTLRRRPARSRSPADRSIRRSSRSCARSGSTCRTASRSG